MKGAATKVAARKFASSAVAKSKSAFGYKAPKYGASKPLKVHESMRGKVFADGVPIKYTKGPVNKLQSMPDKKYINKMEISWPKSNPRFAAKGKSPAVPPRIPKAPPPPVPKRAPKSGSNKKWRDRDMLPTKDERILKNANAMKENAGKRNLAKPGRSVRSRKPSVAKPKGKPEYVREFDDPGPVLSRKPSVAKPKGKPEYVREFDDPGPVLSRKPSVAKPKGKPEYVREFDDPGPSIGVKRAKVEFIGPAKSSKASVSRAKRQKVTESQVPGIENISAAKPSRATVTQTPRRTAVGTENKPLPALPRNVANQTRSTSAFPSKDSRNTVSTNSSFLSGGSSLSQGPGTDMSKKKSMMRRLAEGAGGLVVGSAILEELEDSNLPFIGGKKEKEDEDKVNKYTSDPYLYPVYLGEGDEDDENERKRKPTIKWEKPNMLWI
jgi:hypothetical protein